MAKRKKNFKFQDINTFLGNQFKKYKNNFVHKKKHVDAVNSFSIKNSDVHLINNRQSSFSNGIIKHKNVPVSLSRDAIDKQRQALPVYQIKKKIIKVIEKSSTLIFVGETASGKTTQIPQFVLEAKINCDSLIAITQPRRVAAISIATRVSQEQNTPLGELVGYSVRFEEKLSDKTRIKYMTDGMLLREAILDPLLSRYSVIMLDEAHERSIQTDVLFGIVKRAQSQRASLLSPNPLRIVIMSATMDVDHFSKYFDEAPVYYLEGRQYPIHFMYVKSEQDDYVQTALITVLQIHRSNEDGDILVFCTGQEEINAMVSATNAAQNHSPPGLKKLLPLPLHASLPATEQIRIFDKPAPDLRKVIYSTNVAETSLTIPGIRFVVDTCRAKTRNFDSKTGFESLRVERISKAQADQRAGRAGREAPGTCYRLLTQEEFSQLKPFPTPEILRVNLSNVALHLIAIGITNPTTFNFMDKPKKSNMRASLQELLNLESIKLDSSGHSYELTSLGKEMVTFPLDPKFSRILVASREFGCVIEVITILSILYVDNIFYVPPQRREEATNVLKKFVSSEGDHIMLLNVFRGYLAAKGNRNWCKENFIHFRNIEIVKDVRRQLIRLFEKSGQKMTSCGMNTESVRRCILKGLCDHIAVLTREGTYRTVESKEPVYIHPSSCLFGCKPEIIVYTELVQTTKHYMRNVCLVSLEWLTKKEDTS